MFEVKNAKRVVVKVGTSTLTYPSGGLNFRRTQQLALVLSDLKNAGKEIVLVSSGAVGVGVGTLGLRERPVDTPTRQACAAVGQCELMYTYERLFSQYRHKVAQILMTRDTISAPKSCENAKNAFARLLELGVIPIVNENDAVAVDELAYGENNAFGDNDTLSAIVGALCHADLLIILSDIDGLYDADPRLNPDAKLLHEVTALTPEIWKAVENSTSAQGTGGMKTKLNAASLAAEYGFSMAILNGEDPNNLYRLLDGEEIGTRFMLAQPK